jgi:hypothetical protein
MSDRQATLARFLGDGGVLRSGILKNPARLLELPGGTGRHQTRLDRALGDMLRR